MNETIQGAQELYENRGDGFELLDSEDAYFGDNWFYLTLQGPRGGRAAEVFEEELMGIARKLWGELGDKLELSTGQEGRSGCYQWVLEGRLKSLGERG